MALENTNVVDAAGIDMRTGHLVLTLVDSWDWDNPRGHLLAMQAKINAYLQFIESGQIYECYPADRHRQIVIDVVSQFSLPPLALEFLQRAADIASQLSVMLLPADFPEQVEQAVEAALELEEMFWRRQPEELFAAESESVWQGWCEFFSRTREPDRRRKGLVEIIL